MKDEIDWELVEEEGRAKILWLSKYELLNIFVSEQSEINWVTLIDLPGNYRVHEVFYEPTRRAFGFIIFSDEFPKTSKFLQLPSFEEDKLKKVLVKASDIATKIKKEQ